MFVNILVGVSLFLSLFLSAYAIRSLVFLHVAKRAAEKIKLLSHDFSIPQSDFRTYYNNKDGGHSNTRLLQINKSIDNNAKSVKKNRDIHYPFISVLIATHDEGLVIDRLMNSCSKLTYDSNKFEIIVVDDSQDFTWTLLKKWKNKIPNLEVLHRSDRTGWKGGALNLALENLNDKSSYVLVVDADSILVSDTLERFISHFLIDESDKKQPIVIQGYPISINANSRNCAHRNWVARGIDFRLAQRNMVEFLAKDYMSLPLQITGSLFMIRTEVIKTLRFSNDLTEDWDLTLALNFIPRSNIISYYDDHDHDDDLSAFNKQKVIFDPFLISYCEATTKLGSYFMQRMRVGEGHTRGFRKSIFLILQSKLSLIDKLEFFLTGIQYAKFTAIPTLIIVDLIILLITGIDFFMTNYSMKLSLIVQIATLLCLVLIEFMALPLCRVIRNYNGKDILYLLLLNICTTPALVLGSLHGIFRSKGVFHRTQRNSY